jgi:hypothetical protein
MESELAIEGLAAQLFLLAEDRRLGWWHCLPEEVKIEYRTKAIYQMADWRRQDLTKS